MDNLFMQLFDVINGFFCNVKGNRTSHDAVDKSSSKQQICDSALIVFMVDSYRIAGNFYKHKILEKVIAVKFWKFIFGN